MSDQVQSRVIAFLQKPETYNLGEVKVQCISTHGAMIFLAGSRAYKMKRAVAFAYMDFSTLERREAACRHELERNQPAAPDIYQDVIAVVEDAHGKLSLGGFGTPVEWLVVMRRFEQSDVLDSLAARGALDSSVMEPLADVIAAYHRDARVYMPQNSAHRFNHIIEEIIGTFSTVPDCLPDDRVDRFATEVRSLLVEAEQILQTRAEQGRVRLCHGDLHLRNIVLINGHPVLFDAIEFNDDIATVDILYDLAFLLMDLWHRNLKQHANKCFNRYFSVTADASELKGLVALPLFLSLRAAIRAMVGVDLLRTSTSSDDGQQAETRRNIQAYFERAVAFLKPQTPTLIAIGGRSGTGKSTVAAALAPEIGRAPGAIHVRSDVERKRHFGVNPLQELSKEHYAKHITDEIYAALIDRAEQVLATGHSVILDATYLNDVHRNAVKACAAKSDIRFVGLWLEAPERDLIARVNRRQNDASDANADVVSQQMSQDVGPINWARIDTQGDLKAVMGRVRQVLREMR